LRRQVKRPVYYQGKHPEPCPRIALSRQRFGVEKGSPRVGGKGSRFAWEADTLPAELLPLAMADRMADRMAGILGAASSDR
jgi:hypothetical protein